jgi:hypothetical protein
MNALEEYNRFMDGVFDGPDGRCAWVPGRNYIMPNGPIPVERYHEVVTKADAAIADLEAAVQHERRMRDGLTDALRMAEDERDEQFKRAEQAEAALAERDRMLALCNPYSRKVEGYEEWLADLRARAKEGSE